MANEYQEIGSICMGLHVKRAARRITRVYDEALSPSGLNIGQFSLLTTLAAQDDWGMQNLADALGTDRTSLTASLKPLERKKLVRSSPHPSDKRIRKLELTSEGLEALKEAKPYWQAAQERVVDLLGADDASGLRSIFSKLA
jgi:DNA-binding MarR family transcriptional regulator